MKKAILKDSTPLVKALCLLLIMLAGSVIALLLYSLCGNGGSIGALRFLQSLQSILIFTVPCIFGAILWSDRPLHWLRLDQFPSLLPTLLTIALFVCGVPFVNLLSHCNQQFVLPESLQAIEEWMRQSEESAHSLTLRFLSGMTYSDLLINLLVMAILPALSEEILFRGTFQSLFGETRHMHTAIWSCAILFSAIHMQFYGFIPRLVMGAALGYMVAWSGSLWLPIIGHATNNAIAVLSYFVCQHSGIDITLADNIGTGESLWLGIVSCVVVVVLIYALRRSLTMSKASSRKSSGN